MGRKDLSIIEFSKRELDRLEVGIPNKNSTTGNDANHMPN
jgi:hypothetical protein